MSGSRATRSKCWYIEVLISHKQNPLRWYLTEVNSLEFTRAILRDDGVYMDITKYKHSHNTDAGRFTWLCQGNHDALFALSVSKSRRQRFFVGTLVPPAHCIEE